jgi:hypothetical protein
MIQLSVFRGRMDPRRSIQLPRAQHVRDGALRGRSARSEQIAKPRIVSGRHVLTVALTCYTPSEPVQNAMMLFVGWLDFVKRFIFKISTILDQSNLSN